MALLALFPIINPVGAVASFATLTADLPKKELRCQARYTSLYVFAILAAFTILARSFSTCSTWNCPPFKSQVVLWWRILGIECWYRPLIMRSGSASRQ